jgi:negative regulator of flagellin synthesis FlgM
MKPIETSPVARARPAATDAARSVRNAPAAPGSAVSPPAEPGVVAEAQAPKAGSAAPVDTDRVAEIRTALREGTYPLVPAKVADAMIAANYILIEGGNDQ